VLNDSVLEQSNNLLQFILLFGLLFVSIFFSVSETALTSISRIKLIGMLENNVKGADKVEKVIKNKQKLLSTILLGNNVANILATVVTTSLAINNNKSVAVSTVGLTIVILLFAEMIPKIYASQYSEKTSLQVASIISICIYILTPVVSVFNLITSSIIKIFGVKIDELTPFITEDELKSIVNASNEEGVLEDDEKDMINNVFGFGDYQAKDVMIPRTDVVFISYKATYEEVKNLFKENYFSRIPVYKDNVDEVIGVVHLKDFMFADKIENEFKIEQIIREPLFTYEFKSTKELFHLMKNSSISMAVIIDEYGGTAGIVTLEDLIEEIVGEINDEYDDIDDDIEIIKDDEYIVEGSTRIEDVNEMLGTKIESDDFDSIGGYVVGLVGHIPNNGHVIESGDITFIIEEVDKNRIEKIRIYTKKVC
jgi:putative hemolysin